MKVLFVSIVFAALACFTTQGAVHGNTDEELPDDFLQGPFDTDYPNNTFREPTCQTPAAKYSGFQQYWVKDRIDSIPLPCLVCWLDYHWHGTVWIWAINGGSKPWKLHVHVWFYCYGTSVHRHLWFTVPPGCMYCYRISVSCWVTYKRWGTKVLRLVSKSKADGSERKKSCDQVMGRIVWCPNPEPTPSPPPEGCLADVPGEIKNKTDFFAIIKPQIMRQPIVWQGVGFNISFWDYLWIWNPFDRNVTVRITCTFSATNQSSIIRPMDLTLSPRCYYYLSIHHLYSWIFEIPIIRVLYTDVVQVVDAGTGTIMGYVGDGCDANLIRAAPIP